MRPRNDQLRDNLEKVNFVSNPDVSIIMGSQSDWPTMKNASTTLDELEIPHECKIISAHRTLSRLVDYMATARERGIKVMIAGAGGAAHLAGVTAAMTTLPVFGVPIETKSLGGNDSLLSMVQMPGGIPVGTLAIGKAGAVNAALLAVAVLAVTDEEVEARLAAWRQARADAVPFEPKDE